MTNPCPQCGYEDWDAYFVHGEDIWYLYCQVCGFDETENDHVQRLVERGEDV